MAFFNLPINDSKHLISPQKAFRFLLLFFLCCFSHLLVKHHLTPQNSPRYEREKRFVTSLQWERERKEGGMLSNIVCWTHNGTILLFLSSLVIGFWPDSPFGHKNRPRRHFKTGQWQKVLFYFKEEFSWHDKNEMISIWNSK